MMVARVLKAMDFAILQGKMLKYAEPQQRKVIRWFPGLGARKSDTMKMCALQ